MVLLIVVTIVMHCFKDSLNRTFKITELEIDMFGSKSLLIFDQFNAH